MIRPKGLAVLVVCVLSTPAAQADLIVNGSFERATISPAQNIPVGSTGITGWTVILAPIDYMDSASSNPFVNVWAAAEGTRSLDLAGSPGLGGIEQTFGTTPGLAYEVMFSMAGNPTPGPPQPTIRMLTVSAAGQSANFIFDITGRTFADMGWTAHSWQFVAVGSNTTLAFTNTTTGIGADSYGPTLDNVHVELTPLATIVPEPASFLLFLVAGAGLAGWGRVHRKRGS